MKNAIAELIPPAIQLSGMVWWPKHRGGNGLFMIVAVEDSGDLLWPREEISSLNQRARCQQVLCRGTPIRFKKTDGSRGL